MFIGDYIEYMKQFENILETVFVHPESKQVTVFTDQEQFHAFMQSNKENEWISKYPYDYALLRAYEQVYRLKSMLAAAQPTKAPESKPSA